MQSQVVLMCYYVQTVCDKRDKNIWTTKENTIKSFSLDWVIFLAKLSVAGNTCLYSRNIITREQPADCYYIKFSLPPLPRPGTVWQHNSWWQDNCYKVHIITCQSLSRGWRGGCGQREWRLSSADVLSLSFIVISYHDMMTSHEVKTFIRSSSQMRRTFFLVHNNQ